MPQMDGVQFLLRVKEAAPETIRLILTGQTELQAAIDAVNLGSIFRFLTKPCSKDVLSTAIQASLRQYQLIRVEKELLEQTLGGSIQVMTEILSLISPTSFGRATRVCGAWCGILRRSSGRKAGSLKWRRCSRNWAV